MEFTEEQKAQIYIDYREKVFGYILSHINNYQNAEDLTADVFVKVYKKLPEFDETKASISTWIYTITQNTLTDYYRTNKSFEEIPETLSVGCKIEDNICNKEMLGKLTQALGRLEKRQRDIIILRFYSGKTLREIAEQLGISYAYVKILQNKAFDELKEVFEEFGGF